VPSIVIRAGKGRQFRAGCRARIQRRKKKDMLSTPAVARKPQKHPILTLNGEEWGDQTPIAHRRRAGKKKRQICKHPPTTTIGKEHYRRERARPATVQTVCSLQQQMTSKSYSSVLTAATGRSSGLLPLPSEKGRGGACSVARQFDPVGTGNALSEIVGFRRGKGITTCCDVRSEED